MRALAPIVIIPDIEPLSSSSQTGWSATSAGVSGISASR